MSKDFVLAQKRLRNAPENPRGYPMGRRQSANENERWPVRPSF